MTALVISQSRQGTAQTHNVKVTCSHRQKKPHTEDNNIQYMYLPSPFSWLCLFYQQTVV